MKTDTNFLECAAEAAREATAPPVNDAMLERILAARRAGVVVELPAEPAPRTPRRVTMLVSVLGAAAAASILVLGGRPREGTAGNASGALRFSVAHPVPGEEVQVSYIPSSELEGQDSLLLRGRLRAATDEAYGRVARPYQVVAVLRPTGSGALVGRFRLPDSVVYAQFVVENGTASVIDRPAKWYWELLTSASPGDPRSPSFDALLQQSSAYLGASWEGAFDAVKTAVRLYPDRVEGWRSRLFYEEAVLGNQASDSLRALHLPRLRLFDRRYRDAATLDADRMNEMFFYASALKDTATARYWRDRLNREWPATPAGVQARLMSIWPKLLADTSTALKLSEYEKLYRNVEHSPHALQRQGFTLVRLGLDIAITAKDSALALTWAARYLAAQGSWGDSAYVATRLVELPSLRQSQLDRLRYFIRTAMDANASARPLYATTAQWRRELEHRRANLFASLGTALVASGETAAGADSLERAALIGWSTSHFVDAATAWRRAGDSGRAARDLARVAVDPSITPDSAAALARAAGSPPQWNAWTDDSRREMRSVLLAEGTRKTVHGDPRVSALDGKDLSLRSLTEGRPAVVTFWSRNCGPSLQELPEVERLWAALRARGIAFVAITDEPPSKELRAFLKARNLTFPVYLDTRREASNGFQNFGTPNYVILDARGVIRFDQRALESVVRNASLLLTEVHSTN